MQARVSGLVTDSPHERFVEELWERGLLFFRRVRTWGLALFCAGPQALTLEWPCRTVVGSAWTWVSISLLAFSCCFHQEILNQRMLMWAVTARRRIGLQLLRNEVWTVHIRFCEFFFRINRSIDWTKRAVVCFTLTGWDTERVAERIKYVYGKSWKKNHRKKF